MKILLVSVNASYMHTNVAIRTLKTYAEKYGTFKNLQIEIAEYTINQPTGEVLRNIGFSGADAVFFSTYIWNGEYVCKLIPEIKKFLPECLIGAGGPEFGYSAEKYLKLLPAMDFVMFGEGEKTFLQIAEIIAQKKDFTCVKGIYYRKTAEPALNEAAAKTAAEQFFNPAAAKETENETGAGTILYTGDPLLVENLDDLPFAYPEILSGNFEPDHKIYYYESTRGCPFGCAYCLSSVDKRVRFKSLEKVQQELKVFLDAKVKLVKFIDRTYNLNPDRYIPIWEYILQNHNGKTMFHFEIEAEYFSEEALNFLQKVPEGVMQFEMGVQSANKETLKAVNRSANVEILAEKIRRIPRTIHQHLDLIAGLPYEDLESFGKSYDFVMDLRPDALQLGFLKILSGTVMEQIASKNGWKWMETPVYETFSTPYLSFEDVAFLKDVEVATDAYWNKKIFPSTMNYVFRKVSPWAFICSITELGRSKGAFLQARKDLYWFALLNEFAECVQGGSYFCGRLLNSGELEAQFAGLNALLIKDLIRYDFVCGGKKGNFPEWYVHRYDKDRHRHLMDLQDLDGSTRIKFAMSEYEIFDFDVTAEKPEERPGTFELLITY